MPISYGTFEKQLKLLPLTLHADGRATVSMRIGFIEGGEFIPTTEAAYEIDRAVVESILDALPTAGMTRRDDLSMEIYRHLVSSGKLAAGEVS